MLAVFRVSDFPHALIHLIHKGAVPSSPSSLRQGFDSSKTLLPLTHSVVALTDTWLKGNALPQLTTTAKQHLNHRVNQQLRDRYQDVWEMLTQHRPELLTHPYTRTLQQQLQKQLQGSPKLQWLKHVLAFEYVPSTLVMLLVTQTSYDQLQRDKKITKRENRLLMQQEYVRSAASAVIHFVRTYSSFGLVGGAMALTQRHQQLRHWANRTLTEQPALQHLAHRLANHMQTTWNTLYEGNNATFAALLTLMGLNVLSYGIMRPLILNTTFSSTLPVKTEPTLQPAPRQQVSPLSWKTFLGG